MATENNSFNVLKHCLVPEHHLLTEEEAAEVLKRKKISKEQLPKIRVNDPGVKVLMSSKGPIKPGDIIKIVRTDSETAQEFVVYRVVIGG